MSQAKFTSLPSEITLLDPQRPKMRLVGSSAPAEPRDTNSRPATPAAPGRPTAMDLVARQYLHMRERVLSLAADFDRIQRAAGGEAAMNDPRLADLRACLAEVLSAGFDRAENVQLLLSDRTPPPR